MQDLPDLWGKIISVQELDTVTFGDDNKKIGEINPFRYRGYYYDMETGFYYLNSRYYDAHVNLWLILRKNRNLGHSNIISIRFINTIFPYKSFRRIWYCLMCGLEQNFVCYWIFSERQEKALLKWEIFKWLKTEQFRL